MKVVAQLNDQWRVVDDGSRWILEQLNPLDVLTDESDWRLRHHGGILHNLLSYIRKHVGEIDPAALALVQALPSDYRLVLQARGQYRQPPPRSWPRASTKTIAAVRKPTASFEAVEKTIGLDGKKQVGRPRRARTVVLLKAPESSPATVVAVLVAAEAPASPARPVPPVYIRHLAARFIAWRSTAARHVRELEHA